MKTKLFFFNFLFLLLWFSVASQSLSIKNNDLHIKIEFERLDSETEQVITIINESYEKLILAPSSILNNFYIESQNVLTIDFSYSKLARSNPHFLTSNLDYQKLEPGDSILIKRKLLTSDFERFNLLRFYIDYANESSLKKYKGQFKGDKDLTVPYTYYDKLKKILELSFDLDQ